VTKRERNARGIAKMSFDIDYDVPPQPPIPKSDGRVKEGASKYSGVSFNKKMNKWQAHLSIEGKQRCIGYYENEKEEVVDLYLKKMERRNVGRTGKSSSI
jgi:hypothetical protein